MKIAIASGKGGTGKTTVAVALARMLPDAAYVDLDVEEPNGHLFLSPTIDRYERFDVLIPQINPERCTVCGRCASACAFNALSAVPALGKVLFFPDLCHSCGVCAQVCPVPGALSEVTHERGRIRSGRHGNGHASQANFIDGTLSVGEASGASLIRDVVGRLSDDRHYIMDSPPGTNCNVVEALEHADFVVLVTEPTPFGVNDLELALELVRDLGKPAVLVINKHDASYPLAERFAVDHALQVIARLPFDRSIAEHYASGGVISELSPAIAKELQSVVRAIEQRAQVALREAPSGT